MIETVLMIISNVFKLSVTLISFVRRHCFHAFDSMLSSGQSSLASLLFWTLVRPAPARSLSLTRCVCVFIIYCFFTVESVTAVFYQRSTVRLQPSS